LRATGYIFFADLMAAAAPGTVLAVTETTHRQFPELIEAAQRGVVAGGGACVLETSLPSLKGKGGSQCLLYKRALGDAPGGGDDTEPETEQAETQQPKTEQPRKQQPEWIAGRIPTE
jgi:hypothetical protein